MTKQLVPTKEHVFQAMMVVQGAEIWEELGDWIISNKPELGPGTKERFQMASQLQPDEVGCCSSL